MAQDGADDLTTLDGIMQALYDSISGPPERKRDVRRFRSLFAEDARLVRVVPVDDGGGVRMTVFDVDEYFKAACEYVEQSGFFDREAARRGESFGHVTHVFSTYESRHAEDDPEPFARGVNSIQLFHDGVRYWFVNIFWDSERPGNPIPREFLQH
jgi:hypothetical protein